MLVSSQCDENKNYDAADLELKIYQSQVFEIDNKLHVQQNINNKSKKRRNDMNGLPENKV